MILHTIVPIELLEEPCAAARETVESGGVFLELEKTEGKMRISRLISTDPADYLRAEYTPGHDYTPFSAS